MDFKESDNLVILLLREARPRQWLKNLALYAAILFGGKFFETSYLLTVTKAFIVFCGISSAIYLVNDIVDLDRDRAHPFKKSRPLASGKLDVATALLSALATLTFFLYLSSGVGHYFLPLVLAYILIQITYSLLLRNIIIIDAMTVATGFILRVIAGSVAAATSISSWLILATVGISLLLAFGKRRSEKTLLADETSRVPPLRITTRITLAHYPDNLLDSMISMSASFVVLTYSLFAFQVATKSTPRFIASILPPTLAQPKWMMLTIPLVIYGIARYLYVIYEKRGGESPERVLLSDAPLLVTVVSWFFLVLIIIYGLGEAG